MCILQCIFTTPMVSCKMRQNPLTSLIQLTSKNENGKISVYYMILKFICKEESITCLERNYVFRTNCY